MKKAWIFLIVLALLAFSVPVFAQAPAAGSFHAWNQGNLFPYYAVGSATAGWGWGPLWDAISGIDQEWTFSYDGNNYGFTATFEFGMDNFGNTGNGTKLVQAVDNLGVPIPNTFVEVPVAAPPSISWFSTYYKFGDLVKVTIGKPRFNDYTEFSQIEGNNYRRFGDSDFMAIAQLFPVSGLSLAAALYVPPQAAASSIGTTVNYGNNIGLGLSYAVPNLVTVKVMYRADEQSKFDGVQASYGNPNKAVIASANFSGMQGLTLNGALDYNLSVSNVTLIKAFVSAKTSMVAPLSLAADVAFQTTSSGGTSYTGYAVEVNGEYPLMGQWVLGATVGYDSGSDLILGLKYVTGWFNQGIGDWTGFEVWPYLKANFDNGSSFKVGLVYATQGPAGINQTVIAVPIIYVWAF